MSARAMKKKYADLTGTEALRVNGFGHRAPSNKPGSNHHDVYELATGKVVANLTAHEVWAFLGRVEKARGAA